MSSLNQAAWVDAIGSPIRVGPAGQYKPGAGEVLIKNRAIAINPADWMRQSSGFLVKEWPCIFGHDVAGEVVELGAGVTEFSKGQRVIGHALALMTDKNENAGFQNYTVVPTLAAAVIPDSMSYEDASVIPMCLSTAAIGIYAKDFLNMPLPTISPKKSGKTIIVWGGSSSVGSAAVQLAVASGLEVVTTASKKNFDYCKSLGATRVFDHRSHSVFADIDAFVKDADLVGAYDAIGDNDVNMNTAQLLSKHGGGFIASIGKLPKTLPSGVAGNMVFAATLPFKFPEVCQAVYKDFLPAALESGQYKPAPKAEIVGKGLASLQAGVDRLKGGVSATKLVIVL